jgi:hypothetical protein
MAADKLLCSEDCKCTNYTYNFFMYMSDPLAYDIYTNVYEFGGLNNFVQGCGSKYSDFKKHNSNKYIKVNKKFEDYWKNVEKRFDCVGFCQTSYYSEEKKMNIPFTKYLFSGFYRGPVKHKGCFRLLMNWIIKALISFGSLGLGGSLIQILIVFAGLSMLKEEDVKNEEIIEGNKIEEEKKNESNEQKNN